jgi:transcription elongation factor Elf1
VSAQVAPETDSTDTCSRCGRETSHAVRVEIRADTRAAASGRFSRKPHRVATCTVCGAESAVLMPDG